MSKYKHNYSQHYNNNKPKQTAPEVKMDSEPEVTGVAKPEMVVESGPVGVAKPENVSIVNLANETVETVKLPETVIGMVSGCAKLNVRAEANLFSDVVCVLDNTSEIMINVEKSNKDWFYICTASGIEGYCMRKFVEAHL